MVEKAKRFVDADTGESIPIVDVDELPRLTNLTDKDMMVGLSLKQNEEVVLHKQKPGARQKHKMPWEYIMINVEALYQYIVEIGLSDSEMAFIPFAIAHMDYNCMLVDHEYGQFLSTSDIPKLIRWSRNKVIHTLDDMEKRDILVRLTIGNRKCVMMNPDVMYRGYSDEHPDAMKQYESARKNKRKVR